MWFSSGFSLKEKCSVFLRRERQWYFTGILNYSVPGSLWCSEEAVCNPSSWSSTGPMISFKQGGCDCLAKPRYNTFHPDFCVYPLFCTLQKQWAGHWSIQKCPAQTSEQWFSYLLCPGTLQTLIPHAGAGSRCFSGSWTTAGVGGHQPHIPSGMRWISGRCERSRYCWFYLCLLALALYTPCFETSFNTHLN